jgi:competence protein ComEC
MLPSLATAFIVGLFLGSYLPFFPLTIFLSLVLLALGTVVLERFGRLSVPRATWCFGLVLAGILYWFFMAQSKEQEAGRPLFPDAAIEMTGRIVAPVQQAPDRVLMIVALDGITADPWIGKRIRLTWRTPDMPIVHGDRIAFRARLRTPSGVLNPGGFDFAAYLERQGIDAVAALSGSDVVQVVESGRSDVWWGMWNRFDHWRGRIRTAASQSLIQPALGLYLGIVIGDRGYLDGSIQDAFMVTGTIHLLSISGSHLGLVAIVVFVAIRRGVLLLPAGWLLRLSRRVSATRMAVVGTIIPVVGYACLAGAELATVRSLVMVLVALAALWLGYERRIFHMLAAAVFLLLLHDPQAIFDISFQLSFVSVLAIAVWMARAKQVSTDEAARSTAMSHRIWEWIRGAVSLSAVVTLATLPLVALYFNQAPWLGIVANLAAVPVTGAVLVPLGLGATLGPLVFGNETLPFAGVIQWLLDGFVSAVRLIALIPGGEWHIAAPSFVTMIVFYGSLVLMLTTERQPFSKRLASGCVVVILMWWMWFPRLWLDETRFRVTFLDVGQGDSAVIELPDGQVVVIDGGAAYERFDMGRGVVAPFLWNRGIRTIDHLIGTHPQLDHLGGLTWVVRHIAVKHYWGSGEARDELFYRRFVDALHDHALEEHIVREGQDIVSSGPCRLVTLNPPARAEPIAVRASSRKSGSELNNRSVVTRLDCGVHSFLFAADAEREALARMDRQRMPRAIEVIKVPHHGSASSLDGGWLASLHPAYAVVSAGRHNPYGHPHPTVIDTYARQGSEIFRTDHDGAVWFTGKLSDPLLSVSRTQETLLVPTAQPCFWACEQANWGRLWRLWKDS